MKLLSLFSILLTLSCNLGVDTSDPQPSESINESKKNPFFIKEYEVSGPDSSCKIDEAWLGYGWINEIRGGSIKKERIGGIQLTLKAKSLPYNLNDYTATWELDDSRYGFLGTTCGRFVLWLKEEKIPYKFEIHLIEIKEKRTICTISLIPK